MGRGCVVYGGRRLSRCWIPPSTLGSPCFFPSPFPYAFPSPRCSRRSNQCTNGVAEGMYLSRVIMTCICAIYTTGYFARFLFAFRLTEGGLVRSIILTFLLLFLLPVTAFVEAGHCLWAAFAMFNPGAIGVEKRSTTPSSVAKQNSMETSLFSPSAHA